MKTVKQELLDDLEGYAIDSLERQLKQFVIDSDIEGIDEVNHYLTIVQKAINQINSSPYTE